MTIHAKLKAEEAAAEAEFNAQLEGDVGNEASQEGEQQVSDEVADEPNWKEEADKNEQRYRVLQGKYNAETARMQQRIRELESVESEKLSFKDGANSGEQEDESDFALEFPDSAQEFSNVRSEVAELKQQILQEKFLTELTALAPDWNEIDQNPDFLGWLGQPDELSGATRQEMLNQAAGDAPRVAAFINAWKDTQRQASQPTATAPQLSGKYETPSNRAGEALAERGKTYTQAQVNGFYDDVAKGKYRGRQAEAQQIERELDLAAADGRIVA